MKAFPRPATSRPALPARGPGLPRLHQPADVPTGRTRRSGRGDLRLRTRLCSLALLLAGLSSGWAAEDKTTYADHVRPVLQGRCFSCHNPDKKKGGLDVTSYAGLLAGGSGGAAVDTGNHAGSRLWKVVAKQQEPFMPPDGDPLKPAELDTIARWIDGGLLETAASVARKSDKPKLDLVVTNTGKPDGPPPVPTNILMEPVLVAARPSAVTALAASPWAPLFAVSGARQVVLYHADPLELAGILPYPEGTLCSLRFSRNGALVIAAGGHGARAGNVVLFDVRNGRRIAETGAELDTILAADLRANQAMVAWGTTGKKLKVFAPGGTELYAKDKHSEWVTAVGFSPDGVLLASGDRNGGVRVWESDTGAEYLNLEGHRGAITALSWRPDGNVLASASEDGDVILWEMTGGALVKRWTAHGGGTLSVDYAADGRLATCGRDRRVKTWTGDAAPLKDLGETPDLPTRVAWVHDQSRVLAGLWTGDVVVWKHETAERLGTVTQNPPDLATRLAAAEQQLAAFQPQLRSAEEAHAVAVQALAATTGTRDTWQTKAAEAKARTARLKQELAAAEMEMAEAEKQAAALAPELATRQQEADARQAAKQQAAAALAAHQRRIAQLNADRCNVALLAGEERLVTLERDLAEARGALAAARTNQTARHQQQAESRALLGRLEQELPGLETNVARVTAECGRLDGELAGLRAGLPALQTRDQHARELLAAREAARETARKRVEEIQTLGPVLAPPTAPAAGANPAPAAGELAAAERSLSDQAEVVLKLRLAALAQATSEAEAARTAATAATQARQDHETRLAAMEKLVAERRAELTAATTARDQARARREAVAGELPRLEQAAREADQAVTGAEPAAQLAEQALTEEKVRVEELRLRHAGLLPK